MPLHPRYNLIHGEFARRGTSFIEVLIASVLVAGVVVFIAVLFPKASKVEVVNHQRLLATNLGVDTLQELKKKGFDSLTVTDVTPATVWAATALGTANPGCDCSDPNVDFAAIPGSTVTWMTGTAYNVMYCVNYLEVSPAAWTPRCLNAGPPTNIASINTKRIYVRVGWGAQDPATSEYQYHVDQTDLASRF